MEYKEIIPRVRLAGDKEINGKDVLQAAADYGNNGADKMLVFIEAGSDQEWDDGIEMLRKICQKAEIPVMASGRVLRMEDVKKILYAGCEKAVVDMAGENREELLEEVSKKFGKDQIIAETAGLEIYNKYEEAIKEYASTVLCMGWYDEQIREDSNLKIIYLAGQDEENRVMELLKNNKIDGITGDPVSSQKMDFMKLKREYKKEGIHVDTFESTFEWKDFKLNSDGMIPVIVQDYKTDEVLMMAYMNEEAYENTILTGRMTYWSRSRNELWVKGLTSGHYQYVKSMMLDCDNDTILAKVSQIGAACHTGNRSCFYQQMMKKPYDDTNPLNVFEDVYDVIKDRKVHPREGSYTNYLFDKGIDKILKKVGEECTEVVIAAKNNDPVEITYEISDLLYHLMVLMADRGLGWEEITRELARR